MKYKITYDGAYKVDISNTEDKNVPTETIYRNRDDGETEDEFANRINKRLYELNIDAEVLSTKDKIVAFTEKCGDKYVWQVEMPLLEFIQNLVKESYNKGWNGCAEHSCGGVNDIK